MSIRFSILPGISLDGMLHVSIIEGSFTASTFLAFLEALLANMNPYPGPNSVIVMDNCRIHKGQEVVDLIQSRYVLSNQTNHPSIY